MPSQIDFATGRVITSVNIPLAGFNLREDLGTRLGVPVYVDNDANCAALAEAHLTEGGPAKLLVMYTLGTGVGGGVVIDGHVFRGATGLGAELGHVVIQADGPECPGNCPNRGCMEALCSGLALERDAHEPGSREAGVAARADRRRARQGHAAATSWLPPATATPTPSSCSRSSAPGSGVGISNAMNVFEPEVIVIGGGLSAASDLFLDRARSTRQDRGHLPALLPKMRVDVAQRRGGRRS